MEERRPGLKLDSGELLRVGDGDYAVLMIESVGIAPHAETLDPEHGASEDDLRFPPRHLSFVLCPIDESQELRSQVGTTGAVESVDPGGQFHQ